MANFELKEKTKKITDTTENAKYVPEKAKLVGMYFFYLLFFVLMLVLLFLIIGLIQQRYYIGAIIITMISIGGFVFLWKIIRASSFDSKN